MHHLQHVSPPLPLIISTQTNSLSSTMQPSTRMTVTNNFSYQQRQSPVANNDDNGSHQWRSTSITSNKRYQHHQHQSPARSQADRQQPFGHPAIHSSPVISFEGWLPASPLVLPFFQCDSSFPPPIGSCATIQG